MTINGRRRELCDADDIADLQTSSSIITRVRDAPLWAHAVALAIVLIAMIPIIGTQSFFSADEGAAVAQAQLLSKGDGWTQQHPFPTADPSGDAFPLELSSRRGNEYAPFVKHPLYAVLLAGADKLGGRTAMVLLSVLGTWISAIAVALMTRRVAPRPSLDVLALWLAGLVSPLFFDSYVLIAHTVGAACVAVATLWFVRMIDRGFTWPASGIVGVGLFLAVLMRTEALLLALGLVIAALVLARRRRDWSGVLLAVAPLVAAALAAVVEPWWTRTIMGGAPTQTSPLGGAIRGGVVDHLHGFVTTVLLPSYRVDTAAVLTLAIAVLIIGAGIVIVRKPEDRQGPIVLLTAATAAGVLRLFFVPDPVSGLLIAFPVLLLAAVVAPWRELRADDRIVALLVAVAAFAVLVVLTQYSQGGSGEWGGRYFAIGLPLIIPVVAFSLGRLPSLVDPSTRRPVIALLMVALLAFPILAVRTLRSYHQFGDRLVADVVATANRTSPGDGGRPVVISSDGTTARFSVDHLDEQRYLTVDLDNFGAYAPRLRDLGVDELTVVVHHLEDLQRLAGYRVESVSEPVPGWLVAMLRST